MLVNLYTSRIILNALGIDDYGIWNAVAAFVISFSFISNPLVTATQRFLNYDMAKGGNKLNDLFVTSVSLFAIISLVVIIALESVGGWFLNQKMNFSTDVMVSVNILFQLSIFTLIIKLLRMPYESAIIAEEKMSFYAIICMIESFLLLGTAMLIQIDFGYNRLILYGVFNLLSAMLIAFSYKIFCNRKFAYTRITKFKFNKSIIKEVSVFSGWNLFGACASMSATQGISTLINIFFGVTLNAAYGIASQVQSAVSSVVSNLQKASNPQIVKSYSETDLERTRFLVTNVCKFSFLLSLLFAVPLAFNIDFILKIWLGDNIPPMANIFSCLMLCLILLISFSGPMDTAILASGKIKSFQITYSIIIFSNIIFTYIFFRFGAAAYWALIIKCIVELFIIIARAVFLKRKIKLQYSQLILSTFSPCFFVLVISVAVTFIFDSVFSGEGWYRFVFSSMVFVCIFFLSSYLIALPISQKKMIANYISHKIKR